jgi:hypothetical protein
MRLGAMGDEIKAGQRLTGAWHAGHKADRFVTLGLGLLDVIRSSKVVVSLKFFAPASERVMSSTRCPW